MSTTSIEWTERSWNPIVGCSVVSPGCTNCYAMKMASRLDRMGVAHYAGLTQQTKAGAVWTGKLALAPEHVLLEPLRRRKPTTYFVNSMGDLFHEDVPDFLVDEVFAVMALCPQHTFQVLTKRSARMRAYVGAAFDRIVLVMVRLVEAGWPTTKQACERHGLPWTQPKSGHDWYPLRNVWLGVSAEDQKRANERVPDLIGSMAAVRFVSNEPALGPVDYTRLQLDYGRWLNALTGELWVPGHAGENSFTAKGPKLDWIIAGGESGPGARPMHPDWPRQIRDQCKAAGTAFFFKQWGEWLPDDVPSEIAEDLELRNRLATIGEQQFARAGKKSAGRLLDGAEHNAMPEVAR